MKEKITAIVPVYNVQKYINKCVESIINQTYKNLEIILVDDGSTDESGSICDDLREMDTRIKVIHKANGGLSDARNAGIDIAEGNYYVFIDSDDYLELDALEKMYSALRSSNSEIAVCNIMRFYEDGTIKPFYNPTDKYEKWDSDNRFFTLNQPSVCNKMFKAELFKNIRFPFGKYYEDTYVYHELLYKANSVVLTGKTGYWYLERMGSILGQPQYTDRYFDFVEAVYYRAKFLVEKDVQPFGNEACLSLYAAVANAEKNIFMTAENKKDFERIRQYYKEMYEYSIKLRQVHNWKQMVRFVLLRYCPRIHSKLY